MPVLIRFNDNYADEFDVEGFFALSEEDWKAYKAKIKKVIGDNYFTFNIGTNEEIEYDGAKEYLSRLKQVKITQEEYDTLLKLFPYTLEDWNGKKWVNKRQMVQHGCVPFYTDEDLKEMQEKFEDQEDLDTSE